MNQLLYIGTYHHIKPVVHFPKTKKFIFIDTKPRSEFDEPNYFYEGFYRSRFISGLIQKCQKYGFVLKEEKVLDQEYYKNILTIKQFEIYQQHQSVDPEMRLNFDNDLPSYINPTLLTFVNQETNQEIKYYVSTNIEYNMNDELKKDIQESDGLIVSGYYPDGKLLESFGDLSKPKTFYGYSRTWFGNDPDQVDNRNNIIHLIQTNRIETSKYFSQFVRVRWESGEMKECVDLNDLADKR